MTHTLNIPSPRELPDAARQFLTTLGRHHVVAFYGPMGAGKTTFVKALCAALGVQDVVTSPTFAIVNEYGGSPSGHPVYHFDFYRISRLEEAYDLGYEDYFYSGHLCLIEWPEMIRSLLPPDALHVTIEVGTSGERTLRWED